MCLPYAVVHCKLDSGVWHIDDHDDTVMDFTILTRACNKNIMDWDMRVRSKKHSMISCEHLFLLFLLLLLLLLQ